MDNLNEAFSKEAHERSWRFGYEAGIKAAKESQESLIKQARHSMIRQLQMQVSINNTSEQNEDKILAFINHWDTELEGDNTDE